jgi:hypothetical protein
VPLAPDLGRGEHAAGTAHVTESSLTSTVGSATGDTGDTGDSTTGSPRLGRGLVTSLLGAAGCQSCIRWLWKLIDVHGIRLALVLVHASVDGMDNVRADGSLCTVSGGSRVGR